MMNWDDFIRDEFARYMAACYGRRDVPPQQRKEVEQAFLSGMHTLNCNSGTPVEGLTEAIRSRLIKVGCPIGRG